jgi:hypothetical protein
MRTLVSLVVLASLTAPVAAAEYYIVRGEDKKCKVVETRPTEKTVVIIGNKGFATREEADKQVKVVCKD